MAAAAWSVYELLHKACSGSLGTGRFALLLLSSLRRRRLIDRILYSPAVATKTVTRDDMKLLPRGEKNRRFPAEP
jgi:hypothetical protein